MPDPKDAIGAHQAAAERGITAIYGMMSKRAQARCVQQTRPGLSQTSG
jgi:hypothetical protein